MSGLEWVIEAHGCASESLSDQHRLQKLFDALIESLVLHPVSEANWHRFPARVGLRACSCLRSRTSPVIRFRSSGRCA